MAAVPFSWQGNRHQKILSSILHVWCAKISERDNKGHTHVWEVVNEAAHLCLCLAAKLWSRERIIFGGEMGRKDKPLVSVIIPTYNRAQLLQLALASVYAQKGLGEQFDMEVIVIDDASSDATPEVVSRYPGARHLRLDTNRGLLAVLNLGLKAVTGKYVAFLDDDDLWLSDKLSLQVPVLEENPELGLVYSQMIVVSRNHLSLFPPENAPSGSIFRALLMGNLFGTRNVLVQRKAFEKVGYFDETLSTHEDYDMWLRLAFHFPVKFVAEPVGIYFRSIEGKWSTDIVEGHTARDYRFILEKALAMLDGTAGDYAQLRQEALARVELVIASELQWVGELEQMRSHLLRTLRKFPSMAREPWARSSIARMASRFAVASDKPIDAVRALSADLKAAVGRRGLKGQMAIRRLLAGIWSATAIALGPRRYNREASYAATRALIYDPSILGRTLLKLISRGFFARTKETQSHISLPRSAEVSEGSIPPLIVPEQAATPLQWHECLLDLVNDSVMARTIEGRINFWNRRAEELYGWRKEEAIGKISHDLLQTEFPKPLEEIESELVHNRQWEGKLVHTTRDGGRVAVESRWALDLSGQSGTVVEINKRCTDYEMELEARTDKIMTEHEETNSDRIAQKDRHLLSRTLRILCVLFSEMPVTLLASA
jgi:PAS domain S-box-containing protein